MSRSKIKSLSHHDVAHLQPPTNVPIKYELSTPYSFRGIARSRFKRSRLQRQGQRSNQGDTTTFHTYNPQPMSLSSIDFLHPTVSEICLDNLLKVKVNTTRSNQSHTMTLHTYTTPNQCPYQVSTSYTYSFRDIAWTRFYRSKS